MTGAIDIDIVDGEVKTLRGGHVEVPVSSLRSGNPLEDAELQRRVDARRFPTIMGELRDATALGDGRFRVEGDLTFHGVTRAVAGELRVTLEDDRLRIDGEEAFDVREFGVKPPRILMLRVEPEVRVHIIIEAEAV